MPFCTVKGCSNFQRSNSKIRGNSIKYFKFPKNPIMRQLWILACGNTENPYFCVDNARICSQHFTSDSFVKSTEQRIRLRLRINAVPTINVPVDVKEFASYKKQKDNKIGKKLRNASNNVINMSLKNKKQPQVAENCIQLSDVENCEITVENKKRKRSLDAENNEIAPEKKKRKKRVLKESISPNNIPYYEENTFYIPEEFQKQLQKCYEFYDPSWLVKEVIGNHFMCEV